MTGDMFTHEGRMSLVYAYSAARRYSHNCISSEHILLGICAEMGGAARSALINEGVREKDIADRIRSKIGAADRSVSAPMGLSRNAEAVIEHAARYACAEGTPTSDRHLLLSILQHHDCGAYALLSDLGVNRERLSCALRYPGTKTAPQKELKFTLKYGVDMTAEAQSYDPVMHREEETERIINILCRRQKGNPLLLGEAGVGKTAVVEALAARIASKKVPACLADKRLISLDLSSVVSGTKYRGEFEEKLKNILNEIKAAGNIILFIDEIHTISGAGAAEGAIDAANLLKPELARGSLKLIGATTPREYKKHIRRDAALCRRFQSVEIKEPTESDTGDILRALRPKYEAYHKLMISDGAINAAVQLSGKYLSEKSFPDKAIDLMDEGAAEAASAGEAVLTKRYIGAALSHMTGIPQGKINESEKEELLKLPEAIKRKVVGQDEAVDTVCRAVRCGRLVGGRQRPWGTFLFLGSTGVGKTLLAKTLAQELFGDDKSFFYFDMSEYMEKHAVSKLIGSPPGYVGYGEGGALTEAVRRKPYCVLLFDEVEKAHPDVLNILLRLMDEGKLQDGEGEAADFRQTIVIMTSNAGASSGKTAGFINGEKEMRESFLKGAKAAFRPEFLNRIDEVVVFRRLSERDLFEIAERELFSAAGHLKNLGVVLKWNEEAAKSLSKAGGARDIRRAVERAALMQASDKMLLGELAATARLTVTDGRVEMLCS